MEAFKGNGLAVLFFNNSWFIKQTNLYCNKFTYRTIMFEPLDPLLHSQLRLAIMSLLMNTEEAQFTDIKEKTKATAGNLSVQLNKLKDAGYISVEKSFKNNYPLTLCKITEKGISAYENYLNALRSYIKPSGEG